MGRKGGWEAARRSLVVLLRGIGHDPLAHLLTRFEIAFRSAALAHFPATVDDDARTVNRGICAPKGCDHTLAASVGRTEIDEENLVFSRVNQLAERVPAASQIRLCETALEHRILNPIAKPAHRLVHSAKAQIVRDVVADQICISHERAEMYRRQRVDPIARTFSRLAPFEPDEPLEPDEPG